MTIIRILTVTAVSAVLSTAALAHSSSGKIGSGGSAEGGAYVQGHEVFGFSKQSVDTQTNVNHGETSTKASSTSVGGAEWGTVIVGGSASAGSGGSSGHGHE
jgi:hypothetical protein